MKIVIGDREYDGTSQPFIGDLRLLKREFGFGWGTVAERLAGVKADAFMEALGDEDFLDALVAWVWMSRLRAGERDCTRADVEMLALDQVKFVADDKADEGDPNAVPSSAPTDTDRGANEAEAAAGSASKPATTKTSRKRSTAA